MPSDKPKVPPPVTKRGPVPDTMTIPGQRGKGGSKFNKKSAPGPIQKPGRRRP